MGKCLAALLLTSALTSGFAIGKEPLRIDASSDASAEASFRHMTGQASPQQNRQLLEAVIRINLSGVNSAREMIGRPDLQSLGIVPIKDKVAGLSASGIVDLANRTSSVTVRFDK